jgi:hypothetical protein
MRRAAGPAQHTAAAAAALAAVTARQRSSTAASSNDVNNWLLQQLQLLVEFGDVVTVCHCAAGRGICLIGSSLGCGSSSSSGKVHAVAAAAPCCQTSFLLLSSLKSLVTEHGARLAAHQQFVTGM